MKRGIAGLILVACTLAACQKDVYDPNYNSNLGASVPDNFEWSTTKTLTVNVDVNDEYNGKYYYSVRVYDKVPAQGILPVAASAKVNKDMPFSQKIVVPATVAKLYIVQVFKKADASEVISQKEVAMTEGNITCSFKNGSGTRSVSTRADEESIELKPGVEIEKKGNYHINDQYTLNKVDNDLKDVTITVNAGGTLHFAQTTELFQWTIRIKDNGKMTAAQGTKLDMKNSDLINYGEARIYDIEFDNGSIFRNGNAMEGENEGGCFYARNITLVNGNGNGSDKRDLGERSYTSCETLTLINNKLTLKTGAWLKCGTLVATQGGACTLQGEGATISGTNYVGLATIGKIKIESKLTVENDILVECSDSPIEQDNIKDNASGLITIVGTSCNEGGFGNKEKAELGTYTYIIEDMFPTQGDYDMNDIVVSLTATQDDDELEIEGYLKAVGASYAITPYVKVNGEIKPLFENNGEAIEAHIALSNGKTKASPINTIADQEFFPYKEFEIEFDDTKVLTMDDIDFYIIVNGEEIHWNKSSNSDKATWGMRIPGSDFKWPQERVKIIEAYPNFTKWFTDKTFAWYKESDSSLIYNKK